MIGKKLVILWDGEPYLQDKAIVLEKYKQFYIVWFRKDNSIMGVNIDEEVDEVTDATPMSIAFVNEKIRINSDQIKKEKDRIDTQK